MAKRRDVDGYSLGAAASDYVATRIVELMKAQTPPLRQYQLAEAMGLPQPHLSNLLSGPEGKRRRQFQRWHLLAAAKVLGVTERDLLPPDVPVPAAPPSEAIPHIDSPPTNDQITKLAGTSGFGWIRQLLTKVSAPLAPGLTEYFEKWGHTINLLVARAMAEDYTWSDKTLVKDEDYWKRKQTYWENEFALWRKQIEEEEAKKK